MDFFAWFSTGSFDLIYILEIIGTVAFAFWGAQRAISRELDLFGIYFSGLCTAIGGGLVRDCLLGNTPPMSFRYPSYAAWACATITVLLLFNKYLSSRELPTSFTWLLNVADALGLGIFTVVGVNNAINCGFVDYGFLSIFCGVCTAVGGGLLRDTFINMDPTLLSKEIYATAAIIGSVFYYYAQFYIPGIPAVIISVTIITAIRLWAIVRGVDLPKAVSGKIQRSNKD